MHSARVSPFRRKKQSALPSGNNGTNCYHITGFDPPVLCEEFAVADDQGCSLPHFEFVQKLGHGFGPEHFPRSARRLKYDGDDRRGMVFRKGVVHDLSGCSVYVWPGKRGEYTGPGRLPQARRSPVSRDPLSRLFPGGGRSRWNHSYHEETTQPERLWSKRVRKRLVRGGCQPHVESRFYCAYALRRCLIASASVPLLFSRSIKRSRPAASRSYGSSPLSSNICNSVAVLIYRCPH